VHNIQAFRGNESLIDS